MDARAIIATINATAAGNEGQVALQTYLVEKSVEFARTKDSRMNAIVASLLLASCGDSAYTANDRINGIQHIKGIARESLRDLRFEIGGAATESIRQELDANLKEYFQEPIKTLNNQTRRMWLIAIGFALFGFLVRIGMSLATFGIGMWLIINSYTQVVSGRFSSDQLVGSGAAFLSGLITVLLMAYRSPFKDIRQSLGDLGVANAAFMGYIHRILEVSHTFSFYYMGQNGQNLSVESLGKFSELIEDAMKATVDQLSEPANGKSRRFTLKPKPHEPRPQATPNIPIQ